MTYISEPMCNSPVSMVCDVGIPCLSQAGRLILLEGDIGITHIGYFEFSDFKQVPYMQHIGSCNLNSHKAAPILWVIWSSK